MKTSTLGLMTAITLGGLMAFNPMAQAQEKKEDAKPTAPAPGAPGTGKTSPQDRLKQIAEALSLTEEQKEKLKPIFQEQAKKMGEIFNDANLSQEDKRSKIQELRASYNAKIKPILTAEQSEKWDKMQAQMGKGGKKKAP